MDESRCCHAIAYPIQWELIFLSVFARSFFAALLMAPRQCGWKQSMMEVEVQQHSAEELQKARVDVFLSGHNETERAASAPHTQNHEYVFVKTEPRVEVKLEAGVTQPPPVAPVMVVSPIAVPLLVPVATRWSMADAAAVADDDEFLDEGQVDGGDHDDYVPLGQARKPVRGRRVPDLSEVRPCHRLCFCDYCF